MQSYHFSVLKDSTACLNQSLENLGSVVLPAYMQKLLPQIDYT